jgi:hypothetical protein
MPSVSIWMLRMSIVFFLITVITGSILLLNKSFQFHPGIWALLPIHIEVAMFGWVVQFVLGTAYWMFPRFLEGPARGNIKAAIWMVVLLNSGILLSAFAMGNEWVLFTGRILLTAGVIIFVLIIRNRVVSYRNLQE